MWTRLIHAAFITFLLYLVMSLNTPEKNRSFAFKIGSLHELNK